MYDIFSYSFSLPVLLFFSLFNLRFLFFILSLSSLSRFSFSVDFSPSLYTAFFADSDRSCGSTESQLTATLRTVAVWNYAIPHCLEQFAVCLKICGLWTASTHWSYTQNRKNGMSELGRSRILISRGERIKLPKYFYLKTSLSIQEKNIFSHQLHEEQVVEPGF